jgi:hypothetical protein
VGRGEWNTEDEEDDDDDDDNDDMPNQTWTKCCSLNNACIHGLWAKRAKVAAVNDGFLKISLLQKIYIYISTAGELLLS